MIPKLKIANRLIGPNYEPLVIAELGINHGGSLDVAIAMVDEAKRVGVEVIKHQTHIPEDEMSSAAKHIIPKHADQSIYEIISQCALTEKQETYLKQYIERKKIIFLSTPFSRSAVDRLIRMKVVAFKIGSGECNNYPLLYHIARTGKPVILSTGMNDIPAIKKAVNIFKNKKIPYALLHTTNIYPTPPHLVRLGAMVELAKNFPEAVFGLSDHTTNNLACFGAIALGASIVERHFTDKMSRKGPDIICSMDPDNCQKLIEGSKVLWKERGGLKHPVKEENLTSKFAFATVVSIKPVKKGEMFSLKNVWVKRPGTGEIKADKLFKLIGRKAKRNIPPDTHLLLSDITWH